MWPWEDKLTERDKMVFEAGGYGRKQGLGQRPAILIIDVTYAFVGDRPEPILESIKRWRNSSGEEGWQAVAAIQRLLALARPRRVPVFYTVPAPRVQLSDYGRWATKNRRALENPPESTVNGSDIVAAIAPQDGEIVIVKPKPSAFFGTALSSYLIQLGVDSLVITGGTTSGCVRASVVDAFSYNYKVALVAEGLFDRGQASHAINLFDMQAKYADVVSLDEIEEYFNSLPLSNADRG